MLSCVSFPFLFGVIFGDIMHGSLLFLFSAYLCLNKFKPGTALHTYFVPARYLLLLMGAFALFNGFVYNEYASMTTHTFGNTCYTKLVKATGGNEHTYYAYRGASPTE